MAPVPRKAKKGKKNRKHGRMKSAGLAYRNSRRREHNKVRRLRKHLKRHPTDAVAGAAVTVAKATYSG